MKEITPILNKIKGILTPQSQTVFWNGSLYKVDFQADRVAPISPPAQTRPSIYVLDFQSLEQEFVKLPAIAGQKPGKFLFTFLQTEKNLTRDNYYIFFKGLQEIAATTTLEEPQINVSVVYISREEVKGLQAKNSELRMKPIVPVEFCLAGFSKALFPEAGWCVVFFADIKEETLISVLSVDGFPAEIIKDRVMDPVEHIIRTFMYFQGKYPEAGLGNVCVVGLEAEYENQLQAGLPAKLRLVPDTEEFLLGIQNCQAKIKSPVVYFETLSRLLLYFIPLTLMVMTGFAGYNTLNSFLQYRNLKSLVTKLDGTLAQKRERIAKKLESRNVLAMVQSVAPYLSIGRLPSATTEVFEVIWDLADRVSSVRREGIEFKLLKVREKKGHYIITIQGRILGDTKSVLRKRASLLKERFRDLGAEVRFRRLPPRPPVTEFKIEKRL